MNAITSYTDAVTYRSQNKIVIKDASKVIARHETNSQLYSVGHRTLNKEMKSSFNTSFSEIFDVRN